MNSGETLPQTRVFGFPECITLLQMSCCIEKQDDTKNLCIQFASGVPKIQPKRDWSTSGMCDHADFRISVDLQKKNIFLKQWQCFPLVCSLHVQCTGFPQVMASRVSFQSTVLDLSSLQVGYANHKPDSSTAEDACISSPSPFLCTGCTYVAARKQGRTLCGRCPIHLVSSSGPRHLFS